MKNLEINVRNLWAAVAEILETFTSEVSLPLSVFT